MKASAKWIRSTADPSCNGITTESGINGENQKLQPVSEFRTVLPQVLASTAKNLILLDLGMTLAFPTIVIATLLKSQSGLQFTEEQASWFGSIAFICQPAGSLVSGLLFEPLGRKKAMLLVNLPHIAAWLMLSYAKSTTIMYVAAVIMGLGVGFMEAPILTYVGEISQPKWRGVLTSYAGLFVTFGYVFVYFLGTVTDWQTAAFICTVVPILGVFVISQIPESPIWLISKGRLQDAEKSLCWLRGWVSPEHIKTEFHELLQHNYKSDFHAVPVDPSKQTFRSLPEGVSEMVPETSNEESAQKHSHLHKILGILKLSELCRRQTLQPLLMVVVFFFFHHGAGITGTRPFLVRIFEELGSPIDPHLTTVITSIVGFMGNITCMTLVGRVGKKVLSFCSLGSCAVLNLTLCGYGLAVTQSESIAWLPIGCYVLLTYAWSFGMGQVPWMLLSEVFPFKGRGVASGVAAAFSYMIGFVVTKTYLNIHNLLSLPGVFGLYGIVSILGCVYFYYFIPETEGKSLEEVEGILKQRFVKLKSALAGKK